MFPVPADRRTWAWVMAREKNRSATDSTVQKQTNLKPFAPGQSGNPAGRPKGSRNKLGEDFIAALHADFQEHGPATIKRAREQDPVAYIKIIAGLLPKEVKVDDVRDLTDEQLDARIQHLAAELGFEPRRTH
jgi:Family of unknown function (DUF5681)